MQMVVSQLEESPCGQLVPIEKGLMAFSPDPLPREIGLTTSLVYVLDEASRAVATLAGVGETIPNPHLLTAPFMRREAVLSSRIEGTQASLSDLFEYEASRRARGDVVEVHNYVRSMEQGIQLLQKLPICVRLINQLHSTLLQGVRGAGKRSGQVRTSQVWIGSGSPLTEDARYIPPPANLVPDALADWERFANEPTQIPPLIQCAMLHYQFEAIHPYLDGNGRIGRLLVGLFLHAKGIMTTPLLHLSAYFERNRQMYYDQLYRVSATGDWPTWVEYFLTGVAEQANDALSRVRRVRDLQEKYRRLLQERRASGNALRLVDEIFARPYMSAPWASRLLGVTNAGARRILERLVDAGILRELQYGWPRLFVANELLEIVGD